MAKSVLPASVSRSFSRLASRLPIAHRGRAALQISACPLIWTRARRMGIVVPARSALAGFACQIYSLLVRIKPIAADLRSAGLGFVSRRRLTPVKQITSVILGRVV